MQVQMKFCKIKDLGLIFVLQTLNNFFVVFFYTLLTIIWLHKTHLILLSKLPRWKTSKWMEQSTLEFWLVLSFVFWWVFFVLLFFSAQTNPIYLFTWTSIPSWDFSPHPKLTLQKESEQTLALSEPGKQRNCLQSKLNKCQKIVRILLLLTS